MYRIKRTDQFLTPLMDYFQAVNKEKDCREEKKKGITLKEAKKWASQLILVSCCWNTRAIFRVIPCVYVFKRKVSVLGTACIDVTHTYTLGSGQSPCNVALHTSYVSLRFTYASVPVCAWQISAINWWRTFVSNDCWNVLKVSECVLCASSMWIIGVSMISV